MQRFEHAARAAIGALLLTLAACGPARSQEPACPLANQKPMLVTQLFFGLSVQGRGPVTAKEWSAFVRRAVAPRFPDGFTVHDGEGQWLDPDTHAIVHERSKVLTIAAQDTAEVRAGF